MRTIILCCLWLVAVAANAQLLTHTRIVISEQGTLNASGFPLFHSATKPKVAATINKVLQMKSFDHINIEKNPTVYADSDTYTTWNYTVDYSNERLLHVRTSHFFPKQGMNGVNHTEDTDFFFDTATGDLIFPRSFITNEGLAKIKMLLKERVAAMARKRHAVLLKKYPAKDYPDAMPTLESSLAQINTSIDNTVPTLFNPSEKSFSFHYWFDNGEGDPETIPELNDDFSVTFNSEELKPFTSNAWSYYVTHTSDVMPEGDAVSHVWSGLIGGKIPVTIMITGNGENISGKEVYDRYGGVIVLSGGMNGKSFWLNELDEKGVKVGYFEVTPAGGKLTGVWKKADGSKTMDFKATIGGTDPL